jgi:hypothetical protein
LLNFLGFPWVSTSAISTSRLMASERVV